MNDIGKFMVSRRQFLRTCGIAGASLYIPWALNPGKAYAVAIPGGTLDPTSITKYVMPLIVPPAMPSMGKRQSKGQLVDYYEIAMRQFQQQILPTGMPITTVWSYGSPKHPWSFNYPAFTIEAKYGKPTQVKWMNQLVDNSGNYLPHILPIDPTLHWANPAGGAAGRDKRPMDWDGTPASYAGPVPTVTHVHGAHTQDESDGYPEAWYLPNAINIPSGYATVGTWYEPFRAKAEAAYGQAWGPGFSVFQYPNDQRATTLWYHDHTLGMTRANVYAGPAGFYIIRGGPDDLNGRGATTTLPGPAPTVGIGKNPAHEIPIVIQDRSFNADGSLFYPDSRAFFDEYGGPYIPDLPVSPIWNPEFFGNTMVVNGRTWPVLEVEPRRYRFRYLNGCNSRFLILKMVTGNPAHRPASAALPFWQVGAEGGFLPAPVQLETLLMGPAERADTIVDFTNVPAGTEIYLINEGPDEPFGGGIPDDDFDLSDPTTTGQVMKFIVTRPTSKDFSAPPESLGLPALSSLGAPTRTRKLSLNEEMYEPADIPMAALLGTVESGTPVPKLWMDEITENPAVGATEEWEIYNFTADAHPIHIHLVQFEVKNRQMLKTVDEEVVQPVELAGDPQNPESWETGRKDTVIAYPGQVTRVKAKFDKPGLFVWHCHIVEHEDNEMMRPYRVGDTP